MEMAFMYSVTANIKVCRYKILTYHEMKFYQIESIQESCGEESVVQL